MEPILREITINYPALAAYIRAICNVSLPCCVMYKYICLCDPLFRLSLLFLCKSYVKKDGTMQFPDVPHGSQIPSYYNIFLPWLIIFFIPVVITDLKDHLFLGSS